MLARKPYIIVEKLILKTGVTDIHCIEIFITNISNQHWRHRNLSAVSGTRLSKASPISLMAWTHIAGYHTVAVCKTSLLLTYKPLQFSRGRAVLQSSCAAVRLRVIMLQAAGCGSHVTSRIVSIQHITKPFFCSLPPYKIPCDSAIYNVVWSCVFRPEASVGWSESNQLL